MSLKGKIRNSRSFVEKAKMQKWKTMNSNWMREWFLRLHAQNSV